jgi:transposase-like protein
MSGQKRTLVTAAQKSEALRLKDAGKTYREIAKQTGISTPQGAYYTIHGREPKRTRRYHRWTEPERELLKGLYSTGMSVREMCVRYDIHPGSIYRLLGGVRSTIKITIEVRDKVVAMRRSGLMPKEIRSLTGLTKDQVEMLTRGIGAEMREAAKATAPTGGPTP